MKKAFALTIIALFFATAAFSADFAPTLMKLTGPESIHYTFDGSSLDIAINVSGTPANAVFCVFTKGQAENIDSVVNGFLGWHTVNKIDTCIYLAAAQSFAIGNNVIKWDGKDQDGNVVASGDYTYYVFAYDNQTPKKIACNAITFTGWVSDSYITQDYQGNILTKPILYRGASGSTTEELEVIRTKWIIGNDPSDSTLVETTSVTSYGQYGRLVPSPYEDNMYFTFCASTEPSTGHVRKYSWVPNGPGQLQTDWGESGEVKYSMYTTSGWSVLCQGFEYLGDDVLVASNAGHYSEAFESELELVDAVEGSIIRTINLTSLWIRIDDENNHGQKSSGPNQFDVIDGQLFMGSHSSCLNQMIVPLAGEDVEDYNRWINSNGDYLGDHNFEETAANPWVCHDYMVGPYKYHISADANLFSVFPCYDMGAVGFGMYAPDGTGIAYFAFAGETAEWKHDIQFVDYGSAYDGIYTNGIHSSLGGVEGLWYTAHDSIQGTITSGVGVEEAPAAFSVAQNAPNPFNPTTTINFSLAEAGNITINVFNIAGQKVDTIVNDFMDAGSHSVVWDASGFSAGVYFYTVKSGDLSKTMKMTLVK